MANSTSSKNPPAGHPSHDEDANERNASRNALARQLRTIRKHRRMSLQQVADASNLSVAFISQAERGISAPSLNSLQALCNALRIPIGWLFMDGPAPPENEAGRIVRSGTSRTLSLDKKGIRKELLTPDLGGRLQMLFVHVEPGGSSGDELYDHEGEECGHIIKGSIQLTIGTETYNLRAGDSFRFESPEPHGFRNVSEQPCTILWISTPPFY